MSDSFCVSGIPDSFTTMRIRHEDIDDADEICLFLFDSISPFTNSRNGSESRYGRMKRLQGLLPLQIRGLRRARPGASPVGDEVWAL